MQGIETATIAEAFAMTSREIVLPMISLSDLLAREECSAAIDYVSIDIEGAEYEILRTLASVGVDEPATILRETLLPKLAVLRQ